MTRLPKNALRQHLLAWVLGTALPIAWAQADAPRVMVERFEVSGNTLLPAERIDAALARFTGQRSLDELKEAALVVQALYSDAGYGAVVAYLPEQTNPGGAVRITVVEGRISRITVNGQQRSDEATVRASLPGLTLGTTPKVREIDAQIQLANENPARQVEVLLAPGARPGEVEARLQVSEQPVSRWTVSADKTGNERTGRLRASLGFQHADLWGRDHLLSAQLQTAPEKPEAVKVLNANYRVPFYEYSAALDAYAAYSSVDGGTSATAAGGPHARRNAQKPRPPP